MIVDCALYRDGLRAPMGQDAVLEQSMSGLEGGQFVWVGLVDPTPEELGRLAAGFGMHSLAVEDALTAHQRPKLEFYENQLFMVVRTLGYDDPTSQVESGEVAIFMGEHFVVTVRHGHVHPLLRLRAALEAEPQRLAHGPSAILHAVLDSVVDDYLSVVAELEIDTEQIEREVLGEGSATRTSDIYLLKREIIECRQATHPLIAPLHALARDEQRLIHDDIQPFFADISDHVLRAHDIIEGLNELMTAVLNASLAHLQLRQNEDMRKISAWVALAAVPTMVAGIYGMNFQHMPELSWPWAYPAVIGFLIIESLGLLWYFKRNHWL
ncbi:MAG: magnesium/cobalt transporter CorA [Candidatus Nanopelagicales bacterium]